MKLFYTIAVFLLTLSVGITSSHAEIKAIDKNSNVLIWGGCGVTKKAFMTELSKAYEKKTGIRIDMQGGGATKGIRSVAKGKIHIGGACRSAMEFNNKERYVKQIPVAWDAIVFIVNKNNPIENISLDQVRAIYTGKLTNWKQLGGSDAAIELYARQSDISGVGLTLRELVFNDTEIVFHKNTHYVKSSGPAEKAVENKTYALTATGFSSAKRRDVKMLKVSGHEPTYDNIKEGKYILYRPIYLVTKIREKNPTVLDFVEFATSEEGKKILRTAGTLPYTDALHLLGKQFRQYQNASAADF